ncbi:MAG: hypothetical protein Ta2E_04580 [Mycoplasmoidaceae bacterium]|nr:MAG: hypothetical protein Ta2E_04580 [Mycoplasmoidaceae bacterium]
MKKWVLWTIGSIVLVGTGVGVYFIATLSNRKSTNAQWGKLATTNGTINIPNQEEWMKLCNTLPFDGNIKIGGKVVYKNNITGYTFGDTYVLTEIPDNFLYKCRNFNSELLIPNNITRIGDNFLSSTAFSKTIMLPDSVKHIGDNFLRYTRIRDWFEFPDNLETIGNFFLADCYVLDDEFVFPNTIRNVGNGIFHNCRKFYNNIYLGNLSPIVFASTGLQKDPSFSMDWDNNSNDGGFFFIGDNEGAMVTRFYFTQVRIDLYSRNTATSYWLASGLFKTDSISHNPD